MITARLFYQFVFQISLCIVWIHNDSMYVRFGGMRNTKSSRIAVNYKNKGSEI